MRSAREHPPLGRLLRVIIGVHRSRNDAARGRYKEGSHHCKVGGVPGASTVRTEAGEVVHVGAELVERQADAPTPHQHLQERHPHRLAHRRDAPQKHGVAEPEGDVAERRNQRLEAGRKRHHRIDEHA